MKILLIHNYYQQPGGEDAVFEQEIQLLQSAGHTVIEYKRSNTEIQSSGVAGKVAAAKRTVWASDSAQALRRLIYEQKPDIVHFHNTHFMISPSAYYACKQHGVPVVQTIHNYRLICPNALLLRDGRVCEDCLGKTPPWPGIVHKCYRGSRMQTAAVAAMLTFHRLRQTWTKQVDRYIALTEFARQKLIEGGLPPEKITVKSNFVSPDPGIGTGDGEYALFVGRLSPEKGVDVLLDAWQQLGNKLPLKVVGDGPLSAMCWGIAGQTGNVTALGSLSPSEVYAMMAKATCVIVPSVAYETFGRVIIEAFACGTPAIVSDLGALAELVESGRTGLHFRPGDANDLAAKVEWLLDHPEELADMRRNARAEYEAKYTAERNYEMLMAIYEDVLSYSHP